MLEAYIRERRTTRDILIMTHIVLGYPNCEASRDIVAAMVAAGVDLMELQIPFSEPIADGPVILNANQQALARGVRVARCLDVAAQLTREFDIPFLIMTYYNILHTPGVANFTAEMATRGLRGAIIPDLPPEEGRDYLDAMRQNDLAPIFIISPTTSDERMRYLASCGRGFIYCTARKGVTGAKTDFTEVLDGYLARCRQATGLPLALGFGVKDREDVEFLKGKVDIAVIGSETIRLVDRDGVGAVGPFIRSLRPQN